MIKSASNFGGQMGVVHYLRPVQKKVIIIDDILSTLGRFVAAKKLAQFAFPPGPR